MIFISARIYVDIKEKDFSKLQEQRIKEAKALLKKVIWHKYHKQIRWGVSEWMNDRSQLTVRVCDIDADIDIDI